MKNLAVLFAVLFVMLCLPLGLMADENANQPVIPNHTIQQDEKDDAIPNLAEVEGKDLTPVERRIVIQDTIRSNASTGIQTGQ